jgi:hypothetical protein
MITMKIHCVRNLTIVNEETKQTIEDELQFYEKEKRRQQRMEEKLERERIHREETRGALDAAKNQGKADNEEDYKRRRALQLEELQVRS